MIAAWVVRAVSAIAFVLLLPLLAWSRLPLREFSTFTAPSQLLAFIPGYTGILLRRVWYKCTLQRCGDNLTVDWLGVIRLRQSKVGHRCTFGVGAWVGWVDVGDDVMTGNGVTLLSGAGQHSFSDLTRPMREQFGEKRQLVVGNDVWIGANATILADVSSGTVVGAGSIVTKTFPEGNIIAGNPAKILSRRERNSA
ncbi:acyltransferase [Afipia massiliensis]|uniref:Acyltransferase n=1 Tax=Afipia massiliensis TaxID=211460 RepID=A0A4U6BU56_9BRAD|nr:acyltransferase [Afipia massiliensis]TKT72404.1 acyltransferase [Afipia massiliensis]